MAGFQFSPTGVIPIPAEGAFDATALHGAGAAPIVATAPYDPEAIAEEPVAPRIVRRQAAAQASAKSTATVPAAAPAITPRTVIKAARARLKEIKAELRHHEALKKERGQLERMLGAAGKPSASLTQINSRRAG